MLMPASHRLVTLFKAEFPRLFRFGIIGFASLGMSLGLYALLSRVVWQDGPRTVEYVAVIVVVSWINYELNRHFTFQSRPSAGAIGRFATVAVVATGLNSVLFWLGHEVLHVLDFAVIVANTFVVAVFTFTSHRLFTFHERPWRHFKKRLEAGS